MLSLRRFLEQFRSRSSSLISRRRIGAYLLYAAGEIVLIVTGILVAISLNNWNQSRQQDAKFANTVERIYQSLRQADESVRYGLMLYRRQIELIDRLLDDPGAVDDPDLVYRLYNLEAPATPIDPRLRRATQYHTSVLAVDFGKPAQVELASYLADVLAPQEFERQIVVEDSSLRMAPYLVAHGIPRPVTSFGFGGEYERFDKERSIVSEEDRQKALALLGTGEMRGILLRLRALKVLFVEMTDNDRESVRQALELIKHQFPWMKRHYENLGIIGSALPEGWQKSVPMQRVPGNDSLWQIEIELGPGAVKFRDSDSWVQNWGGDGFPAGETYFEGANIPIEPGRYRVLLNLEENWYRFEAIKN